MPITLLTRRCSGAIVFYIRTGQDVSSPFGALCTYSGGFKGPALKCQQATKSTLQSHLSPEFVHLFLYGYLVCRICRIIYHLSFRCNLYLFTRLKIQSYLDWFSGREQALWRYRDFH